MQDSSAWNFAAHGYGITLGNGSSIRGLRIGSSDSHIQSVDGLSLSLWAVGGCPSGRIRGLALGLASPGAGEIQGIAVGGFVHSAVATTGVTAGLVTETGGRQRGITVAALVAHADS
jgi:hypothetical protein